MFKKRLTGEQICPRVWSGLTIASNANFLSSLVYYSRPIREHKCSINISFIFCRQYSKNTVVIISLRYSINNYKCNNCKVSTWSVHLGTRFIVNTLFLAPD